MSVYSANLIEGMKELGVRPFVVAGEIIGPENGVPVIPLPDWWQEHRPVARLVARLGRRLAPETVKNRIWSDAIALAVRRLRDQVGIQIFEMEESFGLAARVTRSTNVPVVIRLHGPWFLVGRAMGVPNDRAYRQRVRSEGRGLQAAAGVTSPSQDVLDRVRQHYGLELPDAAVIPNPVPGVPRELLWSRQDCDPARILYVGRFDRVKGGDLLLQAFARVLQEYPSARLTLAGPESSIVQDGVSGRLQELLDRYLPGPFQERVERLGPLIPEKVRALRKQCMVCVLASRYETFSMTVVEAMACGCPVVAPAVGGIREIVQHERNGLLCRPEDPADLARLILHVLRQPGLAETIGTQARSDTAERYHPRRVAEQTLDYYRRTLARLSPHAYV